LATASSPSPRPHHHRDGTDPSGRAAELPGPRGRGVTGARRAAIEQETVRAVVGAYAAGKIELEKPKLSPHNVKGVRLAPSFLLAKGLNSIHPSIED
jgi:hypothetical protein